MVQLKIYWLSCSLNWANLAQAKSLIKNPGAMHKIYYHNNVPLNPPIVFGSDHIYRTRWSRRSVRPEYCRLSATQKLFRHMASRWWNELPDDIATSSTFSSTVYDYFLSKDVHDCNWLYIVYDCFCVYCLFSL